MPSHGTCVNCLSLCSLGTLGTIQRRRWAIRMASGSPAHCPGSSTGPDGLCGTAAGSRTPSPPTSGVARPEDTGTPPATRTRACASSRASGAGALRGAGSGRFGAATTRPTFTGWTGRSPITSSAAAPRSGTRRSTCSACPAQSSTSPRSTAGCRGCGTATSRASPGGSRSSMSRRRSSATVTWSASCTAAASGASAPFASWSTRSSRSSARCPVAVATTRGRGNHLCDFAVVVRGSSGESAGSLAFSNQRGVYPGPCVRP